MRLRIAMALLVLVVTWLLMATAPVQAHDEDEKPCNFFGGIDVSDLFLAVADDSLIDLSSIFLNKIEIRFLGDITFHEEDMKVFLIVDEIGMLIFSQDRPCVTLIKRPDLDRGKLA